MIVLKLTRNPQISHVVGNDRCVLTYKSRLWLGHRLTRDIQGVFRRILFFDPAFDIAATGGTAPSSRGGWDLLYTAPADQRG
jgi:hypothetical protein